MATWFTFLPSFIFILAGGPYVESTRGNLKLTAPLAAVTAAVVGVIANLALFFIAAVARPLGASGSIDWIAMGMVLAAALALWVLKWGVIRVIAMAAVIGLVLRLAGLA